MGPYLHGHRGAVASCLGVAARRSHLIGWSAGRKCVCSPSCAAENKTSQAATGECRNTVGYCLLLYNVMVAAVYTVYMTQCKTLLNGVCR